MDSDGFSQVSIFVFLIFLSAIFSAAYSAYINSNKIRLKNLASSGNSKAINTLRLENNYDKSLLTIRIINIILNILTVVIFYKYYGNDNVVLSAIIIVPLILILGDILPSTIVKKAPDSYAMLFSPFLRILVVIFCPITYIVSFIEKIIILTFKIELQSTITENELITMIDEVENEGVINKSESDLIRSAIEFNETIVEDIYTPRIDIVGVDECDTMDSVKETFLINGYSRLPVFQNNIDHIIGVIHEKDFYQAINRKEKDFKKIISSVLYVTPNKKISELLRDLQLSKAHMAIVIDEYGGTAGLVTMEDIIEELVGEIWDEHDEVVEWFKKIGENKYIISCNADIDDMLELFNIEPEEELDVTTVNGWLTMIFEEIPEVGGRIIYQDLDITVTKAEANRVLEICVEKIYRECDSSTKN